jgi:predicted alpha/beta superfamily hydrolase
MSSIPTASLLGTEVRLIAARSVEQTFRISVALPSSYATDLERTYPTIYLLDANFYFGMITELTRVMTLCEELPESIVIGIGYPLDTPLAEATKETFRLRDRDLTPVTDPTEENPTGGAAAFLTFIQTELISLIEQEYRADPTVRVLAGHSLGGLFTLYVLLHQPELFSRYVVGSPSLWYGERIIFEYEAAFAQTHTALPVRLYLGIGGREEEVQSSMISNFFQFVARLESRDYEGLVLTRHLVENCGHCASTAPTFQAGFQAVLSRL